MKRKIVSVLICTAVVSSLLAGCGSSSSDSDTTDDTAEEETEDETEEAAEEDTTEEETEEDTEESSEDEVVTNTYGDPDGTHLEMWTFVELHGDHYGVMAELWNEENPDNTIEITCTTYPYSDMHTKLLTSLSAGTGAPDICDVEVGMYPSVVEGLDTWLVPLDDYAEPYMETMVQSRMDTYAGSDGHYYGAPYHVGAAVMYYNVAVMSETMGLTEDEVIEKIEAVETWDDYAALGEEYLSYVTEDGKYWTSVDTGGTDWLWIAMAEYGEDWTGGYDDYANVELESVTNMLTMQQEWLESGIAEISPDGQTDLEAGYQNIMDHNIVSFPKAMWYMSRFTSYMPDETGNWYIATLPVFEEGQINSVGIGGTGTVVTQQSENPELAAEFVCWAKMSEEGEEHIWETLGFDVCNSALWYDDEFAHDPDNQYNQYFMNYPYDVLAEIGLDNIGKISVVEISSTINDYCNTTTLNEVLEEGMDVSEALAELQEAVDLEQY